MVSSWGSITTLESFDITLSPGIDASVFSLTIAPPIDNDIPIDATLTIDDGIHDAITFPDCRVADSSIAYSPTDKTTTFQVRDRRWKWAKSSLITGEYNRKDADNNIVGTEKTASELAGLLLDELGETGYDVSALPEKNPYVNWEYDRPAQMLLDLCNKYGYIISLLINNTIKLYKIGEGESLPTDDKIQYQYKSPIIDKPSKIFVVTGKSKYQIDVKLTAVGFDPGYGDNGAWTPMTTADGGPPSWIPAGGYYFGFQDAIQDDNDRRAAQETAWRAYALPGSIEIDGETINITTIMQNWSDELIETEDVPTQWGQTETKRKRAYITGMHFTASAMADAFDIINNTNLDYYNVDVGYQLDNERGLIIFDEQVFYHDSSFNFIGADLTMTCAFDYKKGAISEVFDDGIAGVIERIEREDVVFYFSVDNTGASLFENGDYVRPKVAEYIDGAMAKYKSYSEFSSTVYSGFINVSPDGNIADVSFASDISNGPMTSISYGQAVRSMRTEEKEYLFNSARLANFEKQKRETG